MSWLSFLTRSYGTLNLWQWGLLLAVPPAIVLLYFLKLRRQPLEVPSTYLWHRTIEDLHVNSLWQRLRTSLLLLLQILFVLLLILACVNPAWEATRRTENRLIFLIDTSASMSATDQQPSRLQQAKDQVRQIIEQMKTGDVAMLVSFSDRAQIEQPFTEDQRLLLRKLEQIRPTHRPSDLGEAMRVAAGLANPGNTGEDAQDMPAAEARPATLYIYSDGGFRSVPETALGNLRPIYISIGRPQCSNVGIVAFDSTRSLDPAAPLELFGRIHNFGQSAQPVTASLYLDDQLVDAKQLELDAGQGGGVSFRLTHVDQAKIRLELEFDDDLPLDNVAYAVVNPPRRSRLLVVTQGNEPLALALATEHLSQLAQVKTLTPDQLASEEYQAAAATGAYDLIIYDRCIPPRPPRANTVYWGSVPKQEGWSSQPLDSPPLIIDTARTHPLMQFVEMTRVLVDQAVTLDGPPGASVMIDGDLGPLAILAPREGYQDLVLGFPLITTTPEGETATNTDWPVRISFPLFVGNMLRYLGGAAADEGRLWVHPGEPIRLRWPMAVREAQVVDPQGHSQKASPASENSFLFGGTDHLGIYQAHAEGNEDPNDFLFAVNLFDPVESDIAPKEVIQTRYEAIKAQAQVEPVRREIWKYLLLAGLAIMIFEWYVYNRRVYL